MGDAMLAAETQWGWCISEHESCLKIGGPHKLLGGGFKCFLFSPLPEEMIQFDSYFSNGLKPPTRLEYSGND